MKLPALSESAAPEELLAGLHDYLDEAESILEQKRIMDLAGLDAVIDALCARVLRLSPTEQQAYADKLATLHNRLTLLQENMTATQQAIQSDLQGLSKRQQAVRAYRKEQE